MNNDFRKNIPYKVLRYSPLESRLQALFLSRHTLVDMEWHSEKQVDDGVLWHLVDRDKWKKYDRLYPLFPSDAQNVQLELTSNGFNLFSNMSNSYKMWSVILILYNLPLWKCMKKLYLIMSLLISWPQLPSRKIDMFLRLLIEKLKELWSVGALTFDF